MFVNSRRSARLICAVLLAATTTSACADTSEAATVKKPKKTIVRKKPARKPTTTIKRTPTTKPAPVATTAAVSPQKDAVLKGYESYFTAFVGAAREPERAKELLPLGMTGDALTRLLEIHRQDAAEGVYWDGTRADILSAPKVEVLGETTTTLRDCQSIGGVVRKKSTKEVVPGTSDPELDDLKVTLVLIGGKWFVTSTELYNDVEGKSKCVPGSPSP
jgi:hypothetical protein